jgi:hypothetical protein
MAIGRMQMNRQLYGLGSYFPPENGREKFGLGSKLKKFARKIIPNEVSEIAVKAAPFVAPFNPLLAGAMAGIGGFDQTGRIGSSLKSGLLTYGGGQLGRYIGGAGFQQGINPFAGYNPASSFGGISSLFTSPIGTQTGLQLGQYEMFGGPGSGGDQATRKAIGEQLAQTSRDAAVPPGTFIDAGVDSGIKVADYTGELISNTGGEVAKQATRGYMDITKDLFSGDFTTMGNAAKELGGKALKDIYTTPVKPYVDASGNLVDSKLDKTAVIATLSMIPTYLDAKKAADDAGIEEFDEAAYNAERDKYMAQYKSSLPASSFGIQAAANGGRIGYKEGMSSQMAMAADMIKRGMDEDTISSITNLTIDQIKQIKQGTTQQKANGGRIGYKEGTSREGITSLKDKDESEAYMLQLLRRIGTEAFFGGEPNPTSRYKEFDKMSPEYQDRVETRREKDRRYFQEPENYSSYREGRVPRYDFYGVENKANGGRIGYREGTPREGIVSLTDEDSGVMYRDPKTGEPLTTTEFLRRTAEDEAAIQLLKEGEESGSQFISRPDDEPDYPKYKRMSQEDKELDFGASSITLPKKKTFRERSMEIAVPKQINREMEDKFENYLKKLVTGKKDGGRIGLAGGGGYYDDDYTAFSLLRDELMQFEGDDYYTATRRAKKAIYGMKDGGRMGFMMGTEVPMRQNQGGITELDYRKTGGFVPVGVKERADDVPAMLSKNEFVFTADAVRGAGGGDINKGAKMMYAKMKALEGKVKKFKKTKKKKVKV